MDKISEQQENGLQNFLNWRKKEIENPTSESCDCITSVLNPSWASAVHDILFHVCETHAKQFGIPLGPYWEDMAPSLLKDHSKNYPASQRVAQMSAHELIVRSLHMSKIILRHKGNRI